MFFLIIYALILILGLIPILVHENALHYFATRFYFSEKTNLDKLLEELDKNANHIQSFNQKEKTTLTSCNNSYQFNTPMRLCFDLTASNNLSSSYREYVNIYSLDVFAIQGDIECYMTDRLGYTYTILIMDDIHQLEVAILPYV